MALPYTTPPSSLPGTPHTMSRPGTPSKRHRPGFPGLLTAIIQDTSNATVMEKQQLSTSRHVSQKLPKFLRHLSPYFNATSIRIPATRFSITVPTPVLLVSTTTHSRGQGQHGHASDTRVRLTPMGIIVVILSLILLLTNLRSHSRRIPLPFAPSSTNILSDEQIVRVWKWEVGRGHYPSSRRTPTSVNLAGVENPGLDATTWDYHPSGDTKSKSLPKGPSRFPASFPNAEALQPVGPKRQYLNISEPTKSPPGPISYPPRPQPNSVIDLDIVMNYCDFSTSQYVRDCLEVLRTGAGLDAQNRLRRGDMSDWRHLYSEDTTPMSTGGTGHRMDGQDIMASLGYVQPSPHELTPSAAKAHQKVSHPETHTQQQIARNIQPPDLKRRQNIVGFGEDAKPHPTHPTADPMCDPDYPRIFHIFWAGPFTDKPYLAVASFLFTQNLGLDLHPDSPSKEEFLRTTCRPQLWVWINPGPAASLPNPRARSQMFDQLRGNPWSAPFLHDKFSEVVKFKMWNTTEQLDNIPELREHWRTLPLFNSGGVKYGTPSQSEDSDEIEEKSSSSESEGVVPQEVEEDLGRFGTAAVGPESGDIEEALALRGEGLNATAAPATQEKKRKGITSAAKRKKKEDELVNRVGSTSSKGYDRLTVVLSDMARFVLTHRFGGVYLDADTIFLRDWEDLWGWKGAFAYRWSRLEKYNTAVLKMHRNSAIGSFLFKSALANGLDFHPMTISRYTKDANLEGLLLRLPDALFDSAWLNTEYYQRDRPPYPYFKRFEDFFDPPKEDSAAPLALGFDGFFRGAYSYHFHNFWWIPFDPARNWPDLGPRFAAGEKIARARALQAKLATEQVAGTLAIDQSRGPSPTQPPRDLAAHAAAAGPTGPAVNERLTQKTNVFVEPEDLRIDDDNIRDDERDLGWATVLKRTFEAYLREERPNMYGEWIVYSS